MKDGSPQVTPVWVDYDDDLILVNTSVGRLKQLNSKRSPKVAIAIANASNQYDVVSIRGTDRANYEGCKAAYRQTCEEVSWKRPVSLAFAK